MVDIHLPDDPVKAAGHYIFLKKHAIETLFVFLRRLNSQGLRKLEQQFIGNENALSAGDFLRLCNTELPVPDPKIVTSDEDRRFIVLHAALTLFEDIDVTRSGAISWIQFVEFIIARSEALRRQSVACSILNTKFDFRASQTAAPYRPSAPKCHFDKLFYWPHNPTDALISFEEGQRDFHVHRSQTLVRKRRISGHTNELLAAEFMPAPFDWVVTAGNDKAICFWDRGFNLVKRWNLNFTVGALCWCKEVNALYAAEHFTPRVIAWRLHHPTEVKSMEETSNEALQPDKNLEFYSGHTEAVQAIVWMSALQCLATASLDSTIRIFDLVQMRRTHVLQGHTKGLTCLAYSPGMKLLISAGFDNQIFLWEPQAGTCCNTLEGHDCSIAAVSIVPEREYEMLSVDIEGHVKLWDLRQLDCMQSFYAGDPLAEKAGEIEPLEPRALLPLGRDRVLVSGRRMVLFDRGASDPRLTADAQIMQLTVNFRKLEFVSR